VGRGEKTHRGERQEERTLLREALKGRRGARTERSLAEVQTRPLLLCARRANGPDRTCAPNVLMTLIICPLATFTARPLHAGTVNRSVTAVPNLGGAAAAAKVLAACARPRDTGPRACADPLWGRRIDSAIASRTQVRHVERGFGGRFERPPSPGASSAESRQALASPSRAHGTE